MPAGSFRIKLRHLLVERKGYVLYLERTSPNDRVWTRTRPWDWRVSAPFREVTFCASYKCHSLGGI
jgi:hypothetical protein